MGLVKKEPNADTNSSRELGSNNELIKAYRCRCGKLLFKSKVKPEGLEIKCPKCKTVIEY